MVQLRLWDQDRHTSTLLSCVLLFTNFPSPTFSLLHLRHLNLRTPASPALPLDHICFMILHNLHLHSLVLYFQWVLPNVLPLTSLVIREVAESWDCWRHWGLKKLCACVLHLAWKRTISTRDCISFHHNCHHHCHRHHLQIVYGFTAQDWEGGKESNISLRMKKGRGAAKERGQG